ncbi:Esa1p-associated factor, partial [Tulasnella sp. 408]
MVCKGLTQTLRRRLANGDFGEFGVFTPSQLDIGQPNLVAAYPSATTRLLGKTKLGMSTAYAVNERVLCYHGPLVYEAKVLKTAYWDETTTKTGTIGEHYFVHYKGWKQTWDEWVPTARLLKLNDTNLALQKSLMAQFKPPAKEKEASVSQHRHSASTSSNFASTSKDAGSSGAQRRKDGGGVSGLGGSTSSRKRGRDEMMDSDAANAKMKKPEMKLDVPDVLKVVLVDDWEAVTKNNQVGHLLVPLPRSPTVEEILMEFKEYCASSDKKLP